MLHICYMKLEAHSKHKWSCGLHVYNLCHMILKSNYRQTSTNYEKIVGRGKKIFNEHTMAVVCALVMQIRSDPLLVKMTITTDGRSR